MGSTLNNRSTTTNNIISSTFDGVSHAIKKKSCCKIGPVPSPVSCPVVSDDVQFKLQISNLKSLDIIHDAFHSNSLLKMIFSIAISLFIPESYVSDNPIRHERLRMTTYTTTVPLEMIHTIQHDSGFKLILALLWRLPNHQDSSGITTVLLEFVPMSLWCCYDSRRCMTT